MMPPDQVLGTAPQMEMAHVLFMDVVGYSKLPMDEQRKLLGLLQELVRNTPAFADAHSADKLISLPTGDGMALVFFDDPESPVWCAIEVSRALGSAPMIALRMGIHSGPVYRVADINAARNVAGGGINTAQRVMDCGDAGHILVSEKVVDVLTQVSNWKEAFQDLGEVEVKHGARVHIFNLCVEGAGNKRMPRKLAAAQQTAALARSLRLNRRRLSLALVGLGVRSKIPLTKATADNTDIVSPGAVLTLQKDNLLMYPATSGREPARNTFEDGIFCHWVCGLRPGVANALPLPRRPVPNERMFNRGEPLWLTGIHVKQYEVVLDLLSQQYYGTRYYARVQLPFKQGSLPSADEVSKTIHELFLVHVPGLKHGTGGIPTQHAPAPPPRTPHPQTPGTEGGTPGVVPKTP